MNLFHPFLRPETTNVLHDIICQQMEWMKSLINCLKVSYKQDGLASRPLLTQFFFPKKGIFRPNFSPSFYSVLHTSILRFRSLSYK